MTVLLLYWTPFASTFDLRSGITGIKKAKARGQTRERERERDLQEQWNSRMPLPLNCLTTTILVSRMVRLLREIICKRQSHYREARFDDGIKVFAPFVPWLRFIFLFFFFFCPRVVQQGRDMRVRRIYFGSRLALVDSLNSFGFGRIWSTKWFLLLWLSVRIIFYSLRSE